MNQDKPSDAELKDAHDLFVSIVRTSNKPDRAWIVAEQLAQAEHQRRQQPASVPAGMVVLWAHQQWTSGGFYIGPAIDSLQAIANKAAAYGREQVQRPQAKQMAWIWYTPNGNGTWMPHVSIEKPIVQSGIHMLQPLCILPEPPTC